ncbi:MAG: hypothetical protein LBD32_02875, partial [Cytophagales bacterium]|nr:hypothetical protein [Cytophagales bacterium]
VFEYKQSESDKQEEKNSLNELLENFKNSDDPISFAESNTDSNGKDVLLKYKEEKEIPEDLKKMKVGEFKVVVPENLSEKNKISKYLGKKGKENFEYVVLEQDKVLSDKTKNEILNVAKTAKACKNIEQLDKFAQEHDLKLRQADVKVGDQTVNEFSKVRDFIHWIFFKGGNSCKDVSDPFEIDKGLIVGLVGKSKKKGTKPFDEVREEIFKKVLLKRKYKILKQRISAIEVDDLRKSFAGQVISGEANDLVCKEQKLNDKVGVKYALFKTLGMEKGESSKLVEDENGGFIFYLQDKRCEPILDENGKRTEAFLKFSEEINKKFLDDYKDINEKAFYAAENVEIFKNEVL